MAELEKMNIDELLNEALENTNYSFSLYDVKQEILSRFAEKDKVIKMMAERIYQHQEVTLRPESEKLFMIQDLIKFYTEIVKQQADKEKEDDS